MATEVNFAIQRCYICQKSVTECMKTDGFTTKWDYMDNVEHSPGAGFFCRKCESKCGKPGDVGSIMKCNACELHGRVESDKILADDGKPLHPTTQNPTTDVYILYPLYHYERFGYVHPRCAEHFMRIFCVMCERVLFDREFEQTDFEWRSNCDTSATSTDYRFAAWADKHFKSRCRSNPCNGFGVCATICRQTEWNMDTQKVMDTWVQENLAETSD